MWAPYWWLTRKYWVVQDAPNSHRAQQVIYPSPWLSRSATVWRADVHCATGTRVATLVARRFDLRKLWVTAASWSSCDNPLIVSFDKVTRVRLYCLQEMRKVGHLHTYLIIYSQVQIRLESSATSMLLTWFI